MDSLPVELVDMILGHSYDIYMEPSEYANGLLVCRLWRDVLSDNRYTCVLDYMIALQKLPIGFQIKNHNDMIEKYRNDIGNHLIKLYPDIYVAHYVGQPTTRYDLSRYNSIRIRFIIPIKIKILFNGECLRATSDSLDIAIRYLIRDIAEYYQSVDVINMKNALTHILDYIS